MTTQTAKARIVGMGAYLPEKILTNSDLEKIVETSDEWIVTRTGIRERRIASDKEYCSTMGIEAGRKALEQAGVSPEKLDIIICATLTPDYLMPSTGAIIQNALGATNATAFDMQAACTGFLYGLAMAKAYIESGLYRNVLLIASEKLSSFVDYEDRRTCVLFGDGAAAALISGEGKGLAIRDVTSGTDGEQGGLLKIPAGGSRCPSTEQTVKERAHFVEMNGKEVFKHAVRRMETSAMQSLEKVGLSKEDIDWLVPHQANLRILDTIAKRLELPDEKVFKTVHKYGNTSASSVAIALDELKREHPFKSGDNILLVAFGGGLTFGASVLTQVDQ